LTTSGGRRCGEVSDRAIGYRGGITTVELAAGKREHSVNLKGDEPVGECPQVVGGFLGFRPRIEVAGFDAPAHRVD
jgi:hypothetical protein